MTGLEMGDGEDVYFKSRDCNDRGQLLVFGTQDSLLLNLTSMERRVHESHASEQLAKSGLKNIKSTKLLNMV